MAKPIIPLNPNVPGFHLMFITNGHQMMFGFGKTLFVSPVTGSRYKFSWYGDENFKVETVGNSEPASFNDLLIAVREDLASSDPDYYFKKYAWDTDDLTQIDFEELRISDVIESRGQFYIVTNKTGDYYVLMSMEGNEVFARIKDLKSKNFTFYRAKSL